MIRYRASLLEQLGTVRYLDARVSDSETVLDAAATALTDGKIVAFPTDTVYGILCSPQRTDAIARIYAGKGRSADKPLSLLLGSVDELLNFIEHRRSLAALAAREFLPGPLTIIVGRPSYIDQTVTAGLNTLGLRVPDHQLLQSLLQRSGPLASTSANLSGARAYDGVGASALPEVDLFVDAGPTLQRRESSVVDFTSEQPHMLREGALAKARFDTWLGNLDVV